jgi:hypothetical protein
MLYASAQLPITPPKSAKITPKISPTLSRSLGPWMSPSPPLVSSDDGLSS